jgi:ethanolamine ammonia-lyase large subunit
MGIPGADDIMLNYQSTSFHDALYARQALGLKPVPEFEDWLLKMQILDEKMIPRSKTTAKLLAEF